MFVHPYMAAKIAEERRRDLIAQAEAHRRVRAAREGRPRTPTTRVRGGRAARVISAVVARSVRGRRPLRDEA
jgi:hypothetical protein